MLLWLAALLPLASGKPSCTREEGCSQVDLQGSLFLQRETLSRISQMATEEIYETLGITKANRTRAADARFLMRASFGPTRETLSELSQKDHSDWILEQMNLPVESLREYYRERVNPFYKSDVDSERDFKPYTPCSPGSRWRRFVFMLSDNRKHVEVAGGQIFVEGAFRSDIPTGLFASRWSGLGNYSAYICFLEEGVGNDVHLSSDQSCHWSVPRTNMPNPALFVSDQSKVTAASMPFQQGLLDTLLLQSHSEACSLDEALHQVAEGEQLLIQAEGGIYAFHPRVQLHSNTPESPMPGLCVPPSFLTEANCKAPEILQSQGPAVPGLRAEVHVLSSSPSGFVSETLSQPSFAFLDPQINYPSTGNAWTPELPKNYYAIRWTGTLTIQQAGEYEFFLESDDGSKLDLDGSEVVNNGGFHGMTEKSGKVNLTAGGHALNIEYYQGSGGAGIRFRWQGPDSSGIKEIVPTSAFQTPPPSTSICLSCGSPGEVANDPAKGHQFRFYTTRDRADQDLDNHFFDRFADELSKSTVWTAKALYAKDQLRQRVAWALSQIFVVSANGFGMDDRTELWLNYYDIFVRNAFGNFRDVLREVTYNPLMGRYLTNTGSSSFDYNGRFPNENYAREIMQLFSVGLDLLHPNGTLKRDAQNNSIPTYGMEQILNFAKVFTGFRERPFRPNIENEDDDNLIDPMIVDAQRHDVHPKPGLYGGFLGDALPSCTEPGVHKFLAKGARFEFYPVDHLGEVLEVSQGSGLYDAFCSKVGNECSFPATLVLNETLQCVGSECAAGNVSIVKVDGRHYIFIPPPCVYPYFQAVPFNTSVGLFALEEAEFCPDGSHIADQATCEQAILAVYGSHDGNPYTRPKTWYPKGCSYRGGRMYFNTDPVGKTKYGDYRPICFAHLFVHEDGKASADGVEANNFAVQWTGGVPSSGMQFLKIEDGPVFSETPCKADAVQQLFVGAYVPNTTCSVCGGDVEVFHLHGDGPAITARTIFKVDGKFYRNTMSTVHVASSTLRNPPAFLKDQGARQADAAALAEVESLLDQLFMHENTAVFISKRLIQRFGTSNPSAAYVEAVQLAFRKGEYGGMLFSGKYGDLAATIAAVLLHKDGDMDGHLHQQFHGSLREPMLKVIHFMRSMEYQDVAHEDVVFRELQDVLGQFPFQSPTVFNFYLADFNLPMPVTTSMPDSMQELEQPEQLVAPEFQIFTPPHFIGFLNGMSSLIKNGVSDRCDSGNGFGIRPNAYDGLSWEEICPMGRLVSDLGDENATIQELDVLLTGGRLTDVAKDVVRGAYRRAPEAQKLKRAQQAVLMTPEFNTFGAPLPQAGPRAESLGASEGSQKPYKATIFLFLAGGADTWNMLVPQDCDLYQEYVDVRTDLHLDPEDLIAINVSNQPCPKFGIHGSFDYLKQLYDEGDLAFMTNMGSLVEPLNKDQYRNNLKEKCVGLFSHSDQQTAAQTLACQVAGNSPRGAGGRITDALVAAADPYVATSFSLAGSAIFAQGMVTNRQIVDEQGNDRFHEFELWREAISNLTQQQHANVFNEQYAQVFLDSIKSTEELGRAIEDVELVTDYSTSSSLENQLSQVAKLIRVHEVRKAERDFFFVRIGGWDMHSNLLSGLTSRFGEINRALRGFVAEMKAQNMWDNVVLASSSEFARTLDSNGGGSDHAWAGQHFILGGKVKGGQMLNQFPSSLKEGAYNDLGRGRLIPAYPWETMLKPIAEWMGLDTSSQETLDAVFPNIGRFNSSIVPGEDYIFQP